MDTSSLTPTRLRTPRLELVACTPGTLQADGDPTRLAELLRARVSDEWPPELYDEDARRWTLERVEAAPADAGWYLYYLVLEDGRPEAREAVGIVGYKGPPADGTVEVGYGVLPGHRRRGYAAEAVAALVERAFSFPGVERVAAETYPHLVPSIGVMEKNGFTFAGAGSDEGTIRYELPRARWERRGG
jgi:RimJ/RimL family protein N-acetyltransferase